MGGYEAGEVGKGSPIFVESDQRLARLLVELVLQRLIENIAQCARLQAVDNQPQQESGQQTEGERERRDRDPPEKPS